MPDAHPPVHDIAAGRPATQSSCSPWSAGSTRERDAARAVDGTLHDECAFHTVGETEPWWRVDLLEPHHLERVEIVNRVSHAERFRHFRIEGSDDDLVWTTLHAKTDDAPVSNDPDAPAVIALSSAEPFRYVRIVLAGHETLHLRRVRIFGVPAEARARIPHRPDATSAFPLTAGFLTGRTWQLLDPEAATVLAPQLRFLPWGAIGGTDHRALRAWHLAPDGRLVLSDESGAPVATFRSTRRDGRLLLQGRAEASANPLALAETAPFDRLATPAEGVDAVWRSSVTRRRNLVIVRASPGSLHEQWPRDLDDADRSWDLCASFFNQTPEGIAGRWCDAAVIQSDRTKYKAIHQLLHEASELWSYDYIMLIDDDMMLSWRTLNALFATVRSFNLLVAQPALTADSLVIQHITRAQPGSLLRFTSFVELMTPIFSREALRTILPPFGTAEIGFGIDHLWRFLLGSPRNRMAIIDAHTATHTRPPFGAYSFGLAVAEEQELAIRYGSSAQFETFGRIDL